MIEHAGVGRRVRSRSPADRRLVDVDDLVDLLEALDRLVLPGEQLRVGVQRLSDRPIKNVVDERRLAGARHARHGHERCRAGTLTSMSLRLCWRAPWTTISPLPFAALLGNGDRLAAGEVVARHRGSILQQVLEGSRVNDLAPVLAGPGTDVDDVVGGPDRVLVVLDHDQRVAEVAQPDERVDQAPVVALVQTDRRLVEDVEHADQTRADLRREPDPLRLSTGERRRARGPASGSRARHREGTRAARGSPSAPARRCVSRDRSARACAGTRRCRRCKARQLVDVLAPERHRERLGP